MEGNSLLNVHARNKKIIIIEVLYEYTGIQIKYASNVFCFVVRVKTQQIIYII